MPTRSYSAVLAPATASTAASYCPARIFSTLVGTGGSSTGAVGGVVHNTASQIDRQGILQPTESDTDIAIAAGRFAYCGPDASHCIGPETEVIEAGGLEGSNGFRDAGDVGEAVTCFDLVLDPLNE